MSIFKDPLVLLAVYGTAVFFLTYLTRKIVENVKPSLKKQADVNAVDKTYKTSGARWWNEVILYSIGPLYGIVLSFSLSSTELFPDMFKSHWLLTAMAGLCVGFLCGWFFKLLKKLLSRAANMDESEFDKTNNVPKPPGGE